MSLSEKRLSLYHLPGLSLREYIEFRHDHKIRKYNLKEIIADISGITSRFPSDIRPVKLLKEYIQAGYYPFFMESLSFYHEKLRQSVNIVPYEDRL